MYHSTNKITRQQLGQVSTTRPVGIMHASGHIMNVNSKALALAEYQRPGITHDGVPLGEDGLPTGELKEPDTMFPVGRMARFRVGS